MAYVRLMLVALVACSDAGAQTPSGIKAPDGWQSQPKIAKAASEAFAGPKGKPKLEAVEAFGEPAMGCYALWMTMSGSGDAKDLAEQLLRGLVDDKAKDQPKRKLEIKDVVKPTAAEGVLSLGFESAPYKGRLRARMGKGKITALACFGSQREPIACDTACTTILGALP